MPKTVQVKAEEDRKDRN